MHLSTCRTDSCNGANLTSPIWGSSISKIKDSTKSNFWSPSQTCSTGLPSIGRAKPRHPWHFEIWYFNKSVFCFIAILLSPCITTRTENWISPDSFFHGSFPDGFIVSKSSSQIITFVFPIFARKLLFSILSF